MEDPTLLPGYKMLIDTRQGTNIKISETDIAQTASFYKGYQAKVRGVQIAVLAGKGFEKARLYERTVQPLGMNVIVFANFDTACTWLSLDRKLVSGWLAQLQKGDA